jgi:hypothetical protein
MAQPVADKARRDQRERGSALAWVALGASLFGWFASSFAGMPWIVIAPAALTILIVVVIWLSLLSIYLTSHPKPVPRGWIAAGVILAVAIAGIGLNLPVRARFALSAPAFSQVVEQAGPPPVQQASDRWDDMHGECPARIGLYAVESCEAISGGYWFFDPLGNALLDYAGFAYLPDGPRVGSEPGLEVQELVHLQGDWYVFIASW